MGRVTLILLLVVFNIHGFARYNPPIAYWYHRSSLDTIKDDLTRSTVDIDKPLTPMEALELVKSTYAANFIKISLQENPEDYYYKLDFADYYLVYEGNDNTTDYYLYHLYEFVLDDIDTGIGHTVTYGWYLVDPSSGKIEAYY